MALSSLSQTSNSRSSTMLCPLDPVLSVKQKSKESCSFRIRRGVSQGSIFGGAFFIVLMLTTLLGPSPREPITQSMLTIFPHSFHPLILRAARVVRGVLGQLMGWSLKWRLSDDPENCECYFFSADLRQSSHQPRLTLTGTPLTKDPAPGFLDVAFGLAFSFRSHVRSIRKVISSLRGTPLRDFCAVRSLSQLCKAFIQPVLTSASPGWYPFFFDALQKDLEVCHRSVCRVVSGCLASTPVPLLLLESLPTDENHVESPIACLLRADPSPPCR